MMGPSESQALVWLAAVAAWPVVYWVWNLFAAVLGLIIFPPATPEGERRAGSLIPGLAEAVSAAVSQVLAVSAGTGIFGLFGFRAGWGLVAAYGGWCLAVVFFKGPVLGLPGSGGKTPVLAGLLAGLAVGGLLFLAR